MQIFSLTTLKIYIKSHRTPLGHVIILKKNCTENERTKPKNAIMQKIYHVTLMISGNRRRMGIKMAVWAPRRARRHSSRRV